MLIKIHWYGKVFQAIEKNMYADDLGTGANTSDDVNCSVELFQKGGFILQNSPNYDMSSGKKRVRQDTYKTKIVGQSWDKDKFALSIVISSSEVKNATKQNILNNSSFVHDPTCTFDR